MAIRKGGERLVIANLHADAYPEASFTVDPEQVPHAGVPVTDMRASALRANLAGSADCSGLKP